MKFIVAFDIGGTNIKCGLINKEGNVFEFAIYKTKEIFSSNYDITNLVKKYVQQSSIEADRIEGIVLGLPCTLSKDRFSTFSCPNLPWLSAKEFSRTLKLGSTQFPLYIERDTNLAVLGEMWKGAAIGHHTIVGIFVGTGLGCGIVLNGRLFTGSHGAAAELGHIPYHVEKAEKCPCGNINCIELFASGKTVEKALEKAPEVKLDISEVFLLVEKGDLYWQSVLNDMLDALSTAAATVVNIIDPEILVLGGGILSIPRFPLRELIQQIREKLRKPEPANSLIIKTSILAEKAALIGARYLFNLINLT